MSAPLMEVGMFHELGYGEDYPSLTAARRNEPWPDQDRVAAYLRAAPKATISPGYEQDVFDPSRTAGTPAMRTDGTYVWPETLAYYVETYNVAVPDELVSHIRNNGWTPPDVDVGALDY